MIYISLKARFSIQFISKHGPHSLLGLHHFSALASCVCAQLFSHVWLFATPWTVACQALLSMGFPRQEYQNGLPFPSPGDLPNPGIEPALPALAGRFFATEPAGKPVVTSNCHFITPLSYQFGQRSLAGYSPCGHKESNTIEWLTTYHLKQKKAQTKVSFIHKVL